MCENLHYESVYFKELHNQQEYYSDRQYIYSAGAAVVSTITSNNNNNNNFKTLLYSGKCFGFWDVFLDSGKCYLYSGKCFGFWDVFLDSGKRLSFWEVCSSFLLTSDSPFSVLSATCQPSKPFSP